ncbi:2595_t:CDS:2 [Diversispora eburnea]|uniref:2595_t:CDS:1 n=1 Tax=Diversispora eburnea TaxID=1213867 RepID=A0A9N8WSS3_9GLOM|nr:2595_t:CDS:2 [Diversispora eburnea]
MNTQARTLLIQNGIDLSSSPPQATLDYPSFTRKFAINNLCPKTIRKSIVSSHQNFDCDSLFWAIINQKETLKSLRLRFVNLNFVEKNSSPIGQFISLQELSIIEDSELHKSDCLFLASSFTQLIVFHYSRIGFAV